MSRFNLGKVGYRNTDFLVFNSTLNLFNGTYITKNIMGVSPSMVLRTAATAKTAVVRVSPNTTYSIIKQSSTRFKFATDIVLNRVEESVLQGSIQYASITPTTEYNYTFTTGANDVVLYVDVTNASENVFLQVVTGTQSRFTIADYPISPSNIYVPSKYDVLSKYDFYVDTTATLVTFYIRCNKYENIYLGYTFARTTVPYSDGGLQQNTDQWRLTGFTEYLYIGGAFVANKAYAYTTMGEWECAISIYGTPDFSGGFHGYEILSFAGMFIDGVYVAFGTTYNGWCKCLTFIQNSVLIKNGTQNDNIANRSAYYEITTEGITIKQKITWLQTLNIDAAYLGMLPIKRKEGTIQITDHFFSDYDYAIYDVTESGHVNNQERAGVKTARIWSAVSGVNALMTVVNSKTDGFFFCTNDASYNKLYFAFTSGAYITSINEIWENEIFVKVDVAYPAC